MNRSILSSGKKGRNNKHEEEEELRRGPWTVEEDTLLIHYIACNGEGRWNLLAKCSGLKRTGKSCRLRWLNYLKPDVKRGNLTPEEQILILQLHSKWGNRWARIAQHLPGRTDNEIKNYWRTRVHKQAKQLKIDVNSTLFRDVVRYFWMPRLIQGMEMGSYSSSSASSTSSQVIQCANPIGDTQQVQLGSQQQTMPLLQIENTSCPNIPAHPILSITEWPRPTESTLLSNDQQNYVIDTDYNSFLNDDPLDVSHMSLDDLELIYPGTVAPAEAVVVTNNSVCDSSMIIENNCMEDSLWMEYMDESWQPRKL